MIRHLYAVLAIVSATLVCADKFSLETLTTDYELHSGRTSACPLSLSYSSVNEANNFIPASSASAGEFKCDGKGGKKLQNGDVIRKQGLNLPSIVSNDKVSFYAGVESATRICGPWAFNASVISWYILNSDSETITDSETGIKLQPGFIYLAYSHFSDLCVYRTIESGRIETASPESKPRVVEEEEKEDERECFPHDAVVKLDSGKYVNMAELKIGDRVLVSGSGQFSEVFAFSHQDTASVSVFLRLTTETGRSIKLTPGHIIYINGEAKTANSAMEGDLLTTHEGLMEKISHITLVKAQGLYNPQTLTGDIVVNDIVATTWTVSIEPVTATSMLLPLRMIYRVVPVHTFNIINKWLNSALELARSV